MATHAEPFHLAIYGSGWEKLPAPRTLPALSTPKAVTKPRPAPSADQPLPFQTATWFAGEPPAVVKIPPTYRFPTASKASACTVLPTPAPTADQPNPSHTATRFAGNPSAVLKPPPA